MKLAEKIRLQIETFKEGEPFGYAQLNLAPEEFFAAAKTLERLVKKNVIKKISKGQFYKPEMSIFGELGPNYDSILRNYLFKDNKRVGYVTGGALYNEMNLTTQMTFKQKIATNRNKKNFNISWLKTYTVKSYVEVTDENYYFLSILDALKDIKSIPDTSSSDATKMLMSKIKKFKKEEIESLIEYSLKYPARVRALLGAILSFLFTETYDLKTVQKSLNPLSTYKLSINPKILPTAPNWFIK